VAGWSGGGEKGHRSGRVLFSRNVGGLPSGSDVGLRCVGETTSCSEWGEVEYLPVVKRFTL